MYNNTMQYKMIKANRKATAAIWISEEKHALLRKYVYSLKMDDNKVSIRSVVEKWIISLTVDTSKKTKEKKNDTGKDTGKSAN
jgi:hypothetical protein